MESKLKNFDKSPDMENIVIDNMPAKKFILIADWTAETVGWKSLSAKSSYWFQ